MVDSWSKVAEGVWVSNALRKPTHAVVGSVHGDEPVGAEIVNTLLKELRTSEVPFPCLALIHGNPAALGVNRRFTEEGSDLNRAFGTQAARGPEETRAAELKEWLSETEALLDLHQTHCPTPPLAVVPWSQQHLAAVSRLGIDTVVTGAERLYGKSMLADWIDSRGGIGVTVETGASETREAFEAGLAIARAFVFRKQMGQVLARGLEVVGPIRVDFEEGYWVRNVGNGTAVEAGELLYRNDSGAMLHAPSDGVLLLPHQGVRAGATAAVLAREIPLKTDYRTDA